MTNRYLAIGQYWPLQKTKYKTSIGQLSWSARQSRRLPNVERRRVDA
jgi:hypothetical protein